MTNLRVMVVDDEPLAREGLADLLRGIPDVTIAGVFGDGISALQEMESAKPDVLCIDIRMPGLDGFDVVAALDAERAPAVIFITAYDSFAVKAFEVNAVDYLLKPVTADRLAAAIARVRAPLAAAIPPERMMNLLESLAESRRSSGAGRLIVREVGRIIVIPTNDVDWIEAADYYARLHIGTKSYLIRESLVSLEKRLDRSRFLRLHRSAIVNLARVRVVEAAERGDGVAVLTTGARIKVTASRRAELEQRLTELP